MKLSKSKGMGDSSKMWTLLVSAGICSAFHAAPAFSFDLETDNPDVKLRWDNTLRYTAAVRLKDPSAKMINALPLTANQDDGNRNFNKGLISNRVDWLSEFDASYKDVGARVSGAAWYDQVYNRSNDGNSPGTYNGVSSASNQFSSAARDIHGRRAEFLDAFVFGKGQIGDMGVSFRAGKYSLVWGETLFFGNNGIAGTQAGTDIVKLISVPNSQFKEVVRPDKQISAQLQVNSEVSLGAYYKFSWEANRLPVAGSYFASTDIIAGGERLFTSGNPGSNGIRPNFARRADMEAKDSGQGGLQVKWHPGDLDLGFYATRYHDRNPVIYQFPGVSPNPAISQIGVYNLAYNEKNTAYGIGASKSVGDFVLSGEISTRRNSTLVSDPQAVPVGVNANNNTNPLYAIGNTAHANFSWGWSMPPNPLAREAMLIGELAWNRRLSVARNPKAVAALSERDAWGIRASYTPSYRQIVSGVDLSVPMSISYFPKGKSSAVPNFGVDKGGDMSIGVEAVYLDGWRMSLSYTHYYGNEGNFLVIGPKGPTFSYLQALKDRDFVALSIRRTF